MQNDSHRIFYTVQDRIDTNHLGSSNIGMVLARSYCRIHLKAFYVHLSLYSCVIVTVAVLVVVRRVAESIIAPEVLHAGHLL